MQKYLKRSLHSFVAVPVLAASFALNPLAGAMAQSPIAAAISPDKTGPLGADTAGNQQSDIDTKQTTDLALKAAKVDAFFAKYGRDRAVGLGMELVTTARKYGLPDYALAGLLQVESSGFDYACPKNKWNGFGYGSCNGFHFDTAEEAIETVAKTLAGENEATARFYAGKTFNARLRVYNGQDASGGTVNPKYVANVNWVMNQIDSMQTEQRVAIASI